MMYIPTDERSITDEQVLNAFDLDLPGLEEVKRAFDSKDLAGAKSHLCSYFHNRHNVKFLFDYRGKPLVLINPEENPYAFQASLGFGENLKAFCLDAGQKMLKNIYVLPGKGRGEINLGAAFENMVHFNFLTDQNKGPRHHLDLFVRGQFFEYLSILYHEQGDEQVCRHFKTVFYKFLETYPLLVSDTSAAANRFQYDEDRDAMSVGFLALSYITLLYTQLPYDAGEAVVFDLIKHLWFLGLQFRRFDHDTYKPHNHHMWERGLIPFMLGTLLPEIPAFVAMRDHGAEIVNRHVHEDFNEGGGYSEHSIAYWSGAALGEMLYRGMCISRANGIALLDQAAIEKIDKSFTILALICSRNERYPTLGDNRAPLVNPILQLGVQMTDNAACHEMLLVRTQKKQADYNILPLDCYNNDAGFVSLHSGFDPQSSSVLMSTKIDCGNSGHNHMDMLSLFVSVKGKTIIGEPYADLMYRKASLGTAQRGYLYNMGAHNTVLAFSQPVCPDRMLADKWGVYRYDSPVTQFNAEENGVYVSAYHVGYAHCRHTRKLLFARNGTLLVRDEMARGNRVPEPHIQRWHLEKGCTARLLHDDALIIEKEDMRLLCVFNKPDSIRISDELDVLCPAILPFGTPLAPVIDVMFSNMQDQTTDLLMVSLNMLMMNITHRKMPDIDTLRQALAELALNMDAPDAVNNLSAL